MKYINRVTKDPDVRKQEILDTAVELFATQGYEKTTITHIAKKLSISQGLCYCYFKSKEEIFNAALEHYADYFVEAYSEGLKDENKSWQEKIFSSSTFFDLEKQDNAYYQFYHCTENKQFHSLLTIKVCDKMYPLLCNMFKTSIEQGKIKMNNPEVAASFLLYGQLGILLDDNRTNQEKIDVIREFLYSIFHQFKIL